MTRKIRTAAALLAAVMASVTTAGAFAGEALRVAKPLRLIAKPMVVQPQNAAPAAIGGLAAAPVGADLKIQSYAFVPTNDKGLRVRVRNAGNKSANTHLLRLTVRRIDGTAVGRMLEVPVMAMGANESRWIAINTSSILPVSVAIADTSFKLDADAGNHVPETNETNNRTWHNL